MCAEREDDAEGEIVLDTARGRAYYSILRQARKRLSEPRGHPPQAGTLRTGYWTDGITLNYQLASEASAGKALMPCLPRIYNFFFFLCQDRGMDPIPLFFNGEFDPGSG